MPVIWESADGRQRLELGLAGYEFPEGAEDERDANWLVVRVAARDGETAWAADDPALLTWEVERLARWLERLAAGRFDQRWCSFSEPNLELRADPLPADEAAGCTARPDERGAAGARVQVFFELELRPPGRQSRVVGRRDVSLAFDLQPAQLRAAARTLRAELRAFPVRKA